MSATTNISPALLKPKQTTPTTIVCMDGRIRPKELGPALIGLAGSGVLLNDDQLATFCHKVQQNGVNPQNLTVTYHENCGACQTYLDEHPSDARSLDEVAKWAAERLKAVLKSNQPLVKIGWSNNVDYKVTGDPHHHNEKTITIDGIGRLSSQAIDPDGFFISARYSPDNNWMNQELSIALGIAMGDHGMGRHYFSINPMNIFIIGENNHPELSSAKLLSQLQNTIDQFKEVVQVHQIDLQP